MSHPRSFSTVLASAVIAMLAAPAAARESSRPIGAGAAPGLAFASAAQGAENATERVSRTVPIGPDGRLSIENIAGHIVVRGGGRNEVSIEAVKRSRDRRDLTDTTIEITSSGGRVDVRTKYAARNNGASVDYTVVVPSSVAVDVKSVSADIDVSGIQGPVQAESVSGNIAASAVARLEVAKSVSGSVALSDLDTDRDLKISTVSGGVTGRKIKAHALELSSVSGRIVLTDVSIERLTSRSVSGDLEYAGTLARNGTYEFNTHSGAVRLTLPESPGFRLTASSFSGAIRSDLPLSVGGAGNAGRVTAGGPPGRFRQQNGPLRDLQATFGDGSADLTLRSFSGEIVISKK